MADGLVNMAGQFAGLPMKDLIGGPLQAACDAQNMLAAATANFIKDVGMKKGADGSMEALTVDFSFQRPGQPDKDGKPTIEDVDLKVPILAIINTPNLSIKETEVKFTMSVASSDSSSNTSDSAASMDGEAKMDFGVYSAKISIHGSVSSHSANARSSDNSAKYDVRVLARDDGPPEGLMKMLDMLQSAIAPVPVTEKKPATV